MSLFNTNSTPIFLKKDSDTTSHIARLKEFRDQAIGKVKDDIVSSSQNNDLVAKLKAYRLETSRTKKGASLCGF